MTRTQIINSIAKKINAQSYLEIGTREGKNFDAIDIEYKVGVDPDPQAKGTYCITSDEFFNLYLNQENPVKFHIIFIDGLHEYKQVTNDILNSLDCLTDGGYIICHDMNPTSELMQRVPRESKCWTGDCWKAWANLRLFRDDLSMFVVDCDYGVGVITKGRQKCLERPHNIQWDYNKHLAADREEILNLINVNQFKQWLNQ